MLKIPHTNGDIAMTARPHDMSLTEINAYLNRGRRLRSQEASRLFRKLGELIHIDHLFRAGAVRHTANCA